MMQCFFCRRIILSCRDAAEDGQPRSFRYSVTAASKVNCFVPKELGSDMDKLQLRSTQFGAALAKHFHCLPDNSNASTLWEVTASVVMCSPNIPRKQQAFMLRLVNLGRVWAYKPGHAFEAEVLLDMRPPDPRPECHAAVMCCCVPGFKGGRD